MRHNQLLLDRFFKQTTSPRWQHPWLLLAVAVAVACEAEVPTPTPDPEPPAPHVVIAGLHRVEVGATVALTASTADGTDVSYTWSSTDPAVATVDGIGRVKGVVPGEAGIVVRGATTGAEASHPIVVVAGATPTVSIAGSHRVPVGTQTTLVAVTVNGVDASYAWESDAPTIASVSGGLVTALQVGEANLRATGSETGASDTFSIAVTGTSAVVVTGPFYLQVGGQAQLAAVTVNQDDASYAWSSSDTTVATVDETGLVRGVGAGAVTIAATGAASGLVGELGITVAEDIPYFDQWAASGHADREAEPFSRWVGTVQKSCARCHSDGGYRDYLGEDGSAVGVVDADAATGTVVQCTTCHNAATAVLDEVTFPSGAVVSGLGPSTRCMVCHQGRASTNSVDTAIANAGVADDEVSADIDFVNIHYFAAAATLLAGRARGAYQYAGQVYDTRFRHVPERDICIECHDQHTLQVRLTACQTCHPTAATTEQLKDIRMMSSLGTDYDGDGNTSEGIYYEMVGVREILHGRIQEYARAHGGPVCYHEAKYPYFFSDTDDNGVCADDEAVSANGYDGFTPRLLRAAYNVQVATKDPGAFAHNAKYVIETLFDSAADLNGALTAPLDLSAMHRNDPGHFNGSGEPARHWDEDEEGVSASCSRCHGASEGFRFFVEYKVGREVLEQGNGLDCATCHDTFANVADPQDAFSVLPLDSVWFPSLITVSRPGDKGNVCAQCHNGRASKPDVDARIASSSFTSAVSPHYLPAAAVKLGAQTKGGYEYDGRSYSSEWTNHLGGSSCVDCHSPANTKHSMLIEDNLERCQLCHVGVTAPDQIRTGRHATDTDGDGDANEALEDELATLADALLTEMHDVAPTLCFAPNSYYKDNNASGRYCDPSEVSSTNRFRSFNPDLLKAAYNYLLWNNEPGAWAHNYDYIAQLLIDSVDDLGGDSSTFVRPTP